MALCLMATKVSLNDIDAKVKANDKSPPEKRWPGDRLFLRLIHAMFNDNELRAIFVRSFDQKVHLEQDGGKNSVSARVSYWVLIAK